MSRLRAIVAVLLLLAVAAGCANIPEQSNPQVAGPADTSEPENTVAPIARDADPLIIAREFVRHATNVDIAKQYLTPEAQKTWKPDAQPMIMRDTFSTIPPPVQEPHSNGTEQTVLIQGRKVGRLGADNSFYASPGFYDDKVTVQRQADGQWRISKPPASTAITNSAFLSAYREVPLYFFDSELNILVPDLRYVAQRPSQGMPSRVLQELLAGPSDMLHGPLLSLLGDQMDPNNDRVTYEDGDLVVRLTGLGDASLDTRKKIAAQIVLSMQPVATGGAIRLLADNEPLVPGKVTWRSSDVPSYTAPTMPSPESGMFVANGRVRSLKDGNPIPGPTGAGQYNVRSAAQSIDGAHLAVVEKYGNEVRLRVGKVDGPLSVVPLTANTMTRPTWRPNANELWTVINGTTVVRLVRTKDGTWAPSTVNSSSLVQFGPITSLRLSRDGTRLAMVAGERLTVAGVDRHADTVTVRSPRTLLPEQLHDVADVDWMTADRLAVATSLQAGDSVFSVQFDGSQSLAYDISNLTLPVRSITAAPGRPLIVTDKESRMWTSSVPGEAWRSQGVSGFEEPLAFYPG
jgi:lipoprotein LpqB-like beta-propeller protein/sporulation and spore germination protein